MRYLTDMTARLAYEAALRLEVMDNVPFPVYDLERFARHRPFVCYGKGLLTLAHYSRN